MVDATKGVGVPAEITAALEQLKTELIQAAGGNFAGLILFGGVARGRYRPGQSDVNVVLLLSTVDVPALEAVAPALKRARRQAAIEAMVLRPDEVPGAAAAFPTKFRDIQKYHRVLHGVDPFAALTVDPGLLRQRVAQEFANMLLRLRSRVAMLQEAPEALALALIETARPFALKLATLLELEGHPVPAEDRTQALFAAAAQAFDLPGAALARLAELRQEVTAEQDLNTIAAGLLTAILRAQATAERTSIGGGSGAEAAR